MLNQREIQPAICATERRQTLVTERWRNHRSSLASVPLRRFAPSIRERRADKPKGRAALGMAPPTRVQRQRGSIDIRPVYDPDWRVLDTS